MSLRVVRTGALSLALLLAGTAAWAQADSPSPPGGASWGNLFGGPSAEDETPVTLSLETPPAPEIGGSFHLVVVLKHGEGYHTYAPGEKMGLPVTITPQPARGIEWGEVSWPDAHVKAYPLLGGEVRLFEGEIRIRLAGKVTEAAGTSTSFSVKVEYAACTDTACLLPQEEVLAGVFDHASAATPARARPDTPAPPPPAGGGDFGKNLEEGLFGALLAAYLWGLAASLSPCVYPMIPVTIAYFGGQGEGRSRGHKLALACLYVLGIVLSYALLGVVAARVGRDLGSVMANPWVVGGVATVLVAMGLSLFGLFELRLPASLQEKLGGGDAASFGGAFFTGAVMGLVAAPCVGPFATSILLYVAQRGDVLVGFLALGSFGLGMGSLFLVLALGVSELPRSGIWLIYIKKVFGYVLIGAGFYFASQLLDPAAATLGWGLYFTVGGAMGGALEPAPDTPARAVKGLMLASLAAGLYLVVAGVGGLEPQAAGPARGAAGRAEGTRWESSLEEARSRARQENRPLFVDFHASWCIPCKQMDRQVFPDPAVQRELAAFVALKLDCTDPESPGAVLKNRTLGVPAMPYLAVFDASGTHRADLSHQGYLDSEAFLALLKKARRTLES